MNSPKETGRPAPKPYRPPVLTVHGDVEDLTQGTRVFARMSDAPAMGRRLRDGTYGGS